MKPDTFENRDEFASYAKERGLSKKLTEQVVWSIEEREKAERKDREANGERISRSRP